MADNSVLPVNGGGTETFANDDIGGVKYPRAKMVWGPDGTANDTDVASGKPLPVQLRAPDGTAAAVNANGSATSANSTPVVIASDQAAIEVKGGAAHDAVDSGNPNKIGAKAVAGLNGLTLVAAGDRTDAYAGLDGVLITRPHCGLEDIVSGNASNTDGTSTQCIATGGSGIKQYLTSCILTNTSADPIYVELKSGTTVKATIPVPGNSGAIFNPPVPLPPNAANEAWNFDPSAAKTTIYCSMIGFKSKV